MQPTAAGPVHQVVPFVDLSPAGSGRLVISLAVIAALALLSWFTMEPGRFRSLTLVLLGFFAFRIGLARLRVMR